MTTYSQVHLKFCDGIDTSCDGIADNDDAVDALTWYSDGDEDTYGDSPAR